MTVELKEMIRDLPVLGLRESQVGSHVYLGHGYVESGGKRVETRVRVWIAEGELRAGVSTADGRVRVCEPFTTSEDRKAFPEAVRRGMRLLLS